MVALCFGRIIDEAHALGTQKTSWFLTKRDFTPSENSPQLNDFCAASANECAQPGHSTGFHDPKLPFFVGARGFEPRASWSQKLLHSHNAAIPEHFPRFELHEVHRISQTGHTHRGGRSRTYLHEL